MLLGIDIGTSACKTTILDSATGRIVATARHPLNYLYPDSVRAEIDAEDLWHSVTSVLRQISAQYPKEVASLKAAAISIVFPTLLPLSADNAPLCNAILYNDRRSQPQVDELNRRLGLHTVERITGNTLTPGTSILPGILWLKQNMPEITAKTKTYATLGTFIIHRLTGAIGMDPAHASLSAMCPMGREHEWSNELLQAVGITAEQLPVVQEGLGTAGHLRVEVAKETGLPKDLPIVWTNGDSVLSAFGAGVAFPGQVFAACGSTDNIIVCADRPSGNPIFCNVRHILPDVWSATGSMSAAGASVKWLCDSLLQCSVDAAMADAKNAAAGCGGLVFLPYLLGERTPVWDANARGVFLGLSLTTGRAEAARAVLEGVACAWRQMLELLEKEFSFRPAEIVTAGGGSTNHLWNQIKATMLDRPLIVLDFNDVGSLGACLTAGLGSGVLKTPQQAFELTAPLRNSHLVEPVTEWKDALDSAYDRYNQLYPAVKHLF